MPHPGPPRHGFKITLYWKPAPFQDHLVLDKSEHPKDHAACYNKLLQILKAGRLLAGVGGESMEMWH
jgi:hypothetical protein